MVKIYSYDMLKSIYNLENINKKIMFTEYIKSVSWVVTTPGFIFIETIKPFYDKMFIHQF